MDFNNALLLGLPDTLLNRLQVLQNAAARLTMRAPKRAHITPTLMSLHWLPVKQRILYKVLLTVFKALHELAPSYIKDLLVAKPVSARSLRSDSQNFLLVPRSHSVTFGDRCFKNRAPLLWNQLPNRLRSCDDLNNFKCHLKTYLFK